MKPDTQIAQAEKALQASSARQYVKAMVQDAQETGLKILEAELGATHISVERTFATLGGIMAMRRLLGTVDRDIRRGQDQAPPR